MYLTWWSWRYSVETLFNRVCFVECRCTKSILYKSERRFLVALQLWLLVELGMEMLSTRKWYCRTWTQHQCPETPVSKDHNSEQRTSIVADAFWCVIEVALWRSCASTAIANKINYSWLTLIKVLVFLWDDTTLMQKRRCGRKRRRQVNGPTQIISAVF